LGIKPSRERPEEGKVKVLSTGKLNKVKAWGGEYGKLGSRSGGE